MICNWLSICMRYLFPWIIHFALLCWSTFWKSCLKRQLVSNLQNRKQFLVVFNRAFIVFTCILIPCNMKIPCFYLPDFNYSNSTLFLPSISVLSWAVGKTDMLPVIWDVMTLTWGFLSETHILERLEDDRISAFWLEMAVLITSPWNCPLFRVF